MRITVIAVGKLRDPAIKEILCEYEKRLPSGLKLEWIEVPAGKGDLAHARAEEAGKIRDRVPERARLAALSEKGLEMDSREFAKWIGKLRDQGLDLCLAIGGADGLDPALIKSADHVVALSRLTFPHELARAIVAEQIYRAFAILANSPYHRG